MILCQSYESAIKLNETTCTSLELNRSAEMLCVVMYAKGRVASQICNMSLSKCYQQVHAKQKNRASKLVKLLT